MATRKTTTKAAAPATRAKATSSGPSGKLDASVRVALFKGPEALLRSIYTDQLRDALREAHGAVEVVRFDGASVQAADVLDECRSPGLLPQHKLVIVDDAEDFVKEATRPMLERYAQAPAEEATLLLRAETWHAGKLDALIEAVGVIVECEPITPAKAVAWATRRAEKAHAATLADEAATLLVERVGPDLGRLDAELAKLSISALAAGAPKGSPPAITRALVAEMTGATREEEAWPFQATLAQGDPAEILAGLANLLEVGRQDAAFIAFILGDAARKLHAASALMRSGMNPFQAAGTARLWGSSRDAMLERARRSSPAELARLLETAVETETRIKSGLADPVRAVTATALRFASR